MVPQLTPTALEEAAAAALVLQENPWVLQHDSGFCSKFLGDLLAIFKDADAKKLRAMAEGEDPEEVAAEMLQSIRTKKAGLTVESKSEEKKDNVKGKVTADLLLPNRDLILPTQAEDPHEETQEQRTVRQKKNVALVLRCFEEMSDFASCQPVRVCRWCNSWRHQIAHSI